MKNYIQSLKFALYCITHPFDGFWDLTHEKRGSIAAANTILILTLIVRIMKLQYTSFIFNKVYWPKSIYSCIWQAFCFHWHYGAWVTGD